MLINTFVHTIKVSIMERRWEEKVKVKMEMGGKYKWGGGWREEEVKGSRWQYCSTQLQRRNVREREHDTRAPTDLTIPYSLLMRPCVSAMAWGRRYLLAPIPAYESLNTCSSDPISTPNGWVGVLKAWGQEGKRWRHCLVSPAPIANLSLIYTHHQHSYITHSSLPPSLP